MILEVNTLQKWSNSSRAGLCVLAQRSFTATVTATGSLVGTLRHFSPGCLRSFRRSFLRLSRSVLGCISLSKPFQAKQISDHAAFWGIFAQIPSKWNPKSSAVSLSFRFDVHFFREQNQSRELGHHESFIKESHEPTKKLKSLIRLIYEHQVHHQQRRRLETGFSTHWNSANLPVSENRPAEKEKLFSPSS